MLGHIPVVRLRSERGLVLQVPQQAAWKHLWLECAFTMDLEFEDVSTFGKASSLLCPPAGSTALSGRAQAMGDMLCSETCLQAL